MKRTKTNFRSEQLKSLLRNKTTRFLAMAIIIILGGVGFAMHRASASPTVYYRSTTVGYTTSPSSFNAEGDTVEFHLASLASYNPPPTTMFIVKVGEDELKKVDGKSGVYIDNIEYHDCKQSELGCDWPVSYKLDVSGWDSGLYYAYLVDGKQTAYPGGLIIGKSFYENFNYVPFIIKDADPHSKILVQLPIDTWAAWDTYNDGAGYYSSPNTTTVSFQRPMKKKFGAIKSDSYMLLKWLADNGYDYDVAGDVDLENYSFLARYKLLIPVGHGEYWTTKMADSLREFRDNGGNIAFMTGNTMYWRSRYNSASQTLETYKLAWLGIDPFYRPTAVDYDPANVSTYFQPSLLTGNAKRAGSEKYDNIKILGIHGDYVSGVGGYKLYNTDRSEVSWIFDGVDVSDGDLLGDKVGLDESRGLLNPEVGVAGSIETDRVEYSMVNGKPVASPSSGAPDNLIILGIGDMTSRRHKDSDAYTRLPGKGAVMSIYNAKPDKYPQWGQGATVLHTGSWNWSKKGLDSQLSYYDPRVARITRNIIDRMSAGSPISTSPVYHQHHITLQQGVDGYKGFVNNIFSATANENRGVLSIQSIDVSSALIRAELPELPDGAIVDSASLSLYGLMEGHRDYTNLIDAVPVSQSYKTLGGQGQDDFNKGVLPAAGKAIRDNYIYGGRIKIHKTRDGEGGRTWGKDKWHTFDITNAVKQWYDGSLENNGVLIFNPGNNVRYAFASSYNDIVSRRPKLDIVYHTENDPVACIDINTINVTSAPKRLTIEQGQKLTASFVIKNIAGKRPVCARHYTVYSKSGAEYTWNFSSKSPDKANTSRLDISLDDGASKVVYMAMDTGAMSLGVHDTIFTVSTRDSSGEGVVSSNFGVTINVVKPYEGCRKYETENTIIPIHTDTYLDAWLSGGAFDPADSDLPANRTVLLAFPDVRVPLFYSDVNSILLDHDTDVSIKSAKFHINVSNTHDQIRDYTVRSIKKTSDINGTPWYDDPSSLLYIVNQRGMNASEWVQANTESVNYGTLRVSQKGFVDVDITNLVQNWIDTYSDNRGFALVPNDKTHFYQSFRSSEDSSVLNRRPYITVTYKYCVE